MRRYGIGLILVSAVLLIVVLTGQIISTSLSPLSSNGTNLTLGSGQFLAPAGTGALPSYSFSGRTGAGMWTPATANTLAFSTTAVGNFIFDASATNFSINILGGSTQLGFGPTGETFGDGAADVALIRDAGNILALKRPGTFGTNAQTLRVYGTTTGPKYVALSHDGTNASIDTASGAGKVVIGGAAQSVKINGVTPIELGSTVFASLPATTFGLIYCTDCTVAGAFDQTCVGGGGGSLAVRNGPGTWKCIS